MVSKDGRRSVPRPQEQAVYVISVAAELAGVHPQTLRMYERRGLLNPTRTPGNTRRYSALDIERIRLITELTQGEGVSLAGVKRFISMREEMEHLHRRAELLERELLERVRRQRAEIVPVRSMLRFSWERETDR